ncbi:MAG: hypothetical protein RBS72_00385 [Sedimentisphaerales bacterium]|jgi:hypothetical protein|nr:hypothetical protein [Sedimentisphaerales bacterium]HNY76937.1 hypothetical protein [Sedimentisphaerales bacterium]HOC62791.1 hypothetical protein [Sedimentisphaerales bacterium]HOH62711.1 hypothetical protein [Sedimentisphaerales bacterium]HPY50951.1 hypothetical protein [Sedimentisphaerales bacterium]
MIEHTLRRQLEPIITRRRRLDLAWRLSRYWLVAALVGLVLIGADWLWGWRLPFGAGLWCIATIAATVAAIHRTDRIGPDYGAIARNIEQHHPDLQALLLAAIEQKPDHPGGRLGYLQTQVLKEAIVHATNHDWLQSIPPRTVAMANISRIAALLLVAAVLSQMVPSMSLLSDGRRGVLASRGYEVTITPGDATVEAGSPVVIVARFDGRIPQEVSLSYGAAGQEQQRVPLTRSVDDAVFGGVISDVRSDLLYHVEYADERTGNYKITVLDRPRLIQADAKIVYPPYTNLPEKTIHDTRRISVVEGSHVTLTFTLNKPVATARLAPRTGIALALNLDPEHPHVLTTSFAAEQSERYELLMADAHGLDSKMPPRFTVDVHKNLPAELKPLFPNRDVAASPLEELALQAEVSDDYGVVRYGVTYTLAGVESRDIVLSDAPAAGQQQIQHLLALEELGAVPDQLLTYHFWADDVGPDGRPRRAVSDMYFAEVRPFDEVFIENQSFQDQRSQQQQSQDGQQQGQQTDELIQMQKQIIIATWNIKQQTDLSGNLGERRDDVDVVCQSQAEALQQARSAMAEAADPSAGQALQAAAEHMETSVDHLTQATQSTSAAELTAALGAEQAAYQELLKLRGREHQIARAQNSGRGNGAGSARSQQQLQQLELTEQENRYETERVAQSREQTARREDLQVLNRLGDLARRQNDMSERLREAEAALRQARNEQERQEILRELKRLRDEQVEALRDIDELQARMDQSQNRQRMADAREQLDDSRSQIRQSAQDLEEGMVSRAITSATRAQRQLEQMRDEFRRNTSSQFSEEMRDMRDRAQQLDQRQDRIAEQMEQQAGSGRRTLADAGTSTEVTEQIEQQRGEIEELIEQMKDVSERSEIAEPLLSRRLYDTLRKASTENLDQALEAAGQLLERNFLPQAREIERRAAQGIDELREGVEEAAESVLGDEAESLRLARQQLDELIRQVDEEAARAAAATGERSDDPNERAVASGRRQPGEIQPQDRVPGGNSPSQLEPSASSETPQQPGMAQDGARSQRDRDGQTARGNRDERGNPSAWGPGGESFEEWSDRGARGPLTGGDYRDWSDRLRDVEEMLTERDLREDVARVRDRARTIRTDFTRHGKEPQWDLVQQQITKPLMELQEKLRDTLAGLESDEALVPIDRDPVPDRFADVVRRYFENLGGDHP